MAFIPGSADGTSNGTTEVEVVEAPASGVRRMVRKITVENTDTASATVSLLFKNGANTRVILTSVLAANVDFDAPIRGAYVLDTTSKSLAIKLAGAVSTTELDWTTHWADLK